MTVGVEVELSANDACRAVERGDVLVVVDVLRSASSIVNALINGAKSIVPAATLKEAYALHRRHPEYLLVGEREGRKPRGFHLGNSPLEFTAERVFGRDLIMTTTSGTIALTRCEGAKSVFVGAFLNAGAVAERSLEVAANERVNVSFVLAGEKGKFSLEDFICAGAISDRFPHRSVEFSDKTTAAVLAFEHAEADLCTNVMKARDAKHLMQLGFRSDVKFSCQMDRAKIVPMYRGGRVKSS